MAWRDQLRPASFRGAAFEVESHDRDLGRRIEVHEYPFRDRAYPEDLGKRTPRHQLTAFVIGPDYIAARDALAAALDAEGPGTLVHPYLGTLRVVCAEARQSESAAEGGMAVFTITFVEAVDEAAPTVSIDSASFASQAAEGALIAGRAGFLARYAADGLTPFGRAACVRIVDDMAGALDVAIDDVAVQGASLYALRAEAAALASQADFYTRRPGQLADLVQGLTSDLRAAARSPASALGAMGRLADFGQGLAPVIGASLSRQVQRTNQASLVALMRQSALAEAVRATLGMTFEAYDDAARVRDDLALRIDAALIEAGDAGDDVAFAGLDALRLAMVKDLTARGASLARVAEVETVSSEPALVIAYRLYGDAARADEIVARNKLAHPGFAPAGLALQVLADA